MRMSRGIFTSVMMKDPLATVPKWYRTSRRTEDRIGVTGSRFLSLEVKALQLVSLSSSPSEHFTGTASVDSPGEVVRDHGSGHSHLLTGQDELADPDETHSVVPGQVLQRTCQPELCQPCLLVLDRVPYRIRDQDKDQDQRPGP